VPAHFGIDVGGEPCSPVDHGQDHAGDRQLRVEPGADQLDRPDELREAFEGVVLGLKRHEHSARGGEGVDREGAE
jgi:hypothetical protein